MRPTCYNFIIYTLKMRIDSRVIASGEKLVQPIELSYAHCTHKTDRGINRIMRFPVDHNIL